MKCGTYLGSAILMSLAIASVTWVERSSRLRLHDSRFWVVVFDVGAAVNETPRLNPITHTRKSYLAFNKLFSCDVYYSRGCNRHEIVRFHFRGAGLLLFWGNFSKTFRFLIEIRSRENWHTISATIPTKLLRWLFSKSLLLQKAWNGGDKIQVVLNNPKTH